MTTLISFNYRSLSSPLSTIRINMIQTELEPSLAPLLQLLLKHLRSLFALLATLLPLQQCSHNQDLLFQQLLNAFRNQDQLMAAFQSHECNQSNCKTFLRFLSRMYEHCERERHRLLFILPRQELIPFYSACYASMNSASQQPNFHIFFLNIRKIRQQFFGIVSQKFASELCIELPIQKVQLQAQEQITLTQEQRSCTLRESPQIDLTFKRLGKCWSQLINNYQLGLTSCLYRQNYDFSISKEQNLDKMVKALSSRNEDQARKIKLHILKSAKRKRRTSTRKRIDTSPAAFKSQSKNKNTITALKTSIQRRTDIKYCKRKPPLIPRGEVLRVNLFRLPMSKEKERSQERSSANSFGSGRWLQERKLKRYELNSNLLKL